MVRFLRAALRHRYLGVCFRRRDGESFDMPPEERTAYIQSIFEELGAEKAAEKTAESQQMEDSAALESSSLASEAVESQQPKTDR